MLQTMIWKLCLLHLCFWSCVKFVLWFYKVFRWKKTHRENSSSSFTLSQELRQISESTCIYTWVRRFDFSQSSSALVWIINDWTHTEPDYPYCSLLKSEHPFSYLCWLSSVETPFQSGLKTTSSKRLFWRVLPASKEHFPVPTQELSLM